VNGGDGHSVSGMGPQSGMHPHCEDLAERIERFLDGELDATEARELDAHLDDCLPCTSERELRARIRELVREGCAERAPADLVARVRARLVETAGAADSGADRG
jgi:mycothiol system anti-sigma-R factor